MASQLTNRRRHIRRPGLAKAARALNVTLSHLRRVVIGERISHRLTKRLRTWQAEQRTARKISPTKPPHPETSC